MIGFFGSFFAEPSMWGIGLAVAFGAIWLVTYRPPLFRKPWLWAVLPASAIITLTAITFIQIPLRSLWSQEIVLRRLLLAGIPALLLGGLVQEGAKLIPVVAWWWRKGKNIDPKLGLAIGAVAGVGFGMFEAQWIHNHIFASGWTWASAQAGGVVALAEFWERFWFVSFHTAASALAGYGLAKGWGWQFYLLAAFLHAVVGYSHLLVEAELLSPGWAELYIAGWAGLTTGIAHWLGEREPASVARHG